MRRRGLIVALAAIVVVGLTLTVLSLLGAGFDLRAGGLRVSARNPVRPFVAAAIALSVLLSCAPELRARAARLVGVLEARRNLLVAVVLIVLCAGVLTVGLRYGSFVASAADSYGYVTQAEALTGQPAVTAGPGSLVDAWPDASRSLTPLGYVLTLNRTAAASYPPGLPLLMAAFIVVGGHSAMYLVVPLSACLAILATAVLGARCGWPSTGLAAAFLLACSPVFLLHSAVPMSDVPVTALWTGAVVAAASGTGGAGLWAGLLSGAALLVRPNLAPLLLPVLGILTLVPDYGWRRSRRPVLLFVAGAVPGGVALLYLNAARYGSLLASGYGPLDSLFAANYLGANVTRFASWLLRTQTVFALLGVVAILPGVARAIAPTRREVHLVRLLLLYAFTVFACYAFYLPFDSWSFLRFLLPALPALLVLAVMVAQLLCRRAGDLREFALCAVVAVVGLMTWGQAVANGVLTNEHSVRRFVDVPRYAARELPANAIFLTRLYSGSMRYYGGRPTIRWDQLPSASLDAIVDVVQRRGFVPYLVIEQSEAEMFKAAFPAQRMGRLDRAPVAEYRSTEVVRIYDLRNQDPSLSGDAAPKLIPVGAQPVPRT